MCVWALADGQTDNKAEQEREEYNGSRQTPGASLPPRLELRPAQTSSLTLLQTRCGPGSVS